MADELFALTRQDVQRLRRMLYRVERADTPRPSGEDVPLHQRSGVLGFLESSVAGVADLNSDPNVGTLSVYTFTSTGSADTTEDLKVYHFATVAATTDRWTQCKWCSGRWVIDFQACSTT